MPIDQEYNTQEYSEWLEARHVRASSPLFTMRQYDRSFGVMDEIAARAYEDIRRFMDLVGGEVEYLHPRWRLLHNDADGGNDPSVYCSFRVGVKVPGLDEQECGYDDPPEGIVMDEDRRLAFSDMVESCEMVDPGEWNHLVQMKLYQSGRFGSVRDLLDARRSDHLDGFTAAREQWLMERKTQHGQEQGRAGPRM